MEHANTTINWGGLSLSDMVTAFLREIDAAKPSTSVIEAVCAVTGKDPVEAPPLFDTIDPDCLDGLFEGAGEPTVTFTYDGHEVEVSPDTIRVVD